MKLNEKIDAINKRLDLIETKLPKLTSVVDSEQQIFNEEIDNLIKELDDYSIYINYELNSEIANILSNNNKDLIKYSNIIAELQKIIRLNKREEYYMSSSGFDELIYKISYSKEVDLINKNIKTLLEKFHQYGIDVSVTNFDFSYFTLKYISEFYDNESSNDFYIKMKRYFDEIYWICPNIIKHLVLNFLYIIEKHKKQIHKHILSERSEMLTHLKIDENNLINDYLKISTDYEIISLKDTFYLYEMFASKTDLLKKFLSNKYEQIKTKYLSDAVLEDNSIIIDNIRNFRINLSEYVNIIRFKYIIEYVKNAIKTNIRIKSNDKTIARLIKIKNTYNSKIIKLNNKKDKLRIFGSNNPQNDKKIRVNNAYLIDSVDELYRLQIEKNINDLNNELANNIGENTTIYEALNIVSKHYLAFSNIIYNTKSGCDVIKEIDDFNDFIYSKNTFIIRNTPLDKIDNISSMIEKKYSLCNVFSSINYDNLDDINKTIEDLLYLEVIFNLNLKGLSINDISICVNNKQD